MAARPVVHVFNPAGRGAVIPLPKPVKDALNERVSASLDVYHTTNDLASWPARCDFYATTSGLTVAVERAAADVDAMPVVLPEGGRYLAQRVAVRSEFGLDTWIFYASRAGMAARSQYPNVERARGLG